ncbi:LysE family translocator [Pararobbsia silviterrae]|uniref:LysE family translocator n=1 Tax=Pararobbsia silviterrae TaxID=1792498 RepID=A0A494Y1D1_9BURK|nr:LysE family transporter [Pararobbsia silviterrae]RKP53665.1 LysE family translocator [Pararobbsia silviterrae]
MVSLNEVGLFLLGVVLVLAMPGPTNTLLAAAGLARGFRRSARLTLAECAGYVIAISFWGLFLFELARATPWLPWTVRLLSAVYIAYLAVRMWSATLDLADGKERVVEMRTLFVATLLNPKAILFGGTLFPKAAFASVSGYVEIMGCFLVLLFPIGLLWVAFGAQLGKGRLAWLKPIYVLRGASVVLAAFSVTVAWSAIR